MNNKKMYLRVVLCILMCLVLLASCDSGSENSNVVEDNSVTTDASKGETNDNESSGGTDVDTSSPAQDDETSTLRGRYLSQRAGSP